MGHIITFAQQKGGAGKTTILAHLAVCWLTGRRSVAVVDLDPQASLSRWAGMRDDPRLTLVETRDYRAGGDLKTAARGHDFVLVDCPGAASGLLENAVRESDLVVAPCQPSAMDAWATATILKTAATLKIPVAIVLNRMPPRHGSLDDVLAALGPAHDRLLATTLGNRIGYSQAMLVGRTAPEIAPRSKAAAEIAALTAEIEASLAEG